VGQQQASHFQYEDQQLASLESKNVGVSGRLQAIQVTNEILLAQAQQLQLIRQLLITLINTEAVFHGARVSSDVQGVMETSQFLNAGGNAMTRATGAIMSLAFALGACEPRPGEAPPTQDALSGDYLHYSPQYLR
jgi:P-type conjugative transfer protein TrbJ